MKMLPIQQLKFYLGTLHGIPDTPDGWAHLKCLVDIFCLAQMRDWYEAENAKVRE